MDPRTLICTALALVAFGANSVLCRVALQQTTIDPATFTTLRVVSGAVMLLIVQQLTRTRALPGSAMALRAAPTWSSAAVLCVYAVPFSFAYTGLTAGTGALLLFGSVQVTMLVAAWRMGERIQVPQWAGLVAAAAGLVYLVLPSLATPAWDAALSMIVAGVAWGFYSLWGRGAADPLANTTTNFVRSVPIAGAVSLALWSRAHVDTRGALLAITSGAVTSGLGYVVWYTALRGLTAVRAALVQFTVPILAAAGGVLFLSETISLRLIVAGLLVLGGLTLALPTRRPT